MELTSKQFKLVERFWKQGKFTREDMYSVFSTQSAREECYNHLTALGIIKEKNFVFHINRERYLKLVEENELGKD